MSSPEVQAKSAAPKGGGKKWLVIGVGLLALAGAGVVARGKLAPKAEAPKPAVPVEPTVVELEPLVFNLNDPAGDRYFRLTVRLLLDQRAIAERCATGLPHAKLRDHLLSVLSRKRAMQLTTPEGRETLRQELHGAASELFTHEPLHDPKVDPAPARVLEVYFTEFLLQ